MIPAPFIHHLTPNYPKLRRDLCQMDFDFVLQVNAISLKWFRIQFPAFEKNGIYSVCVDFILILLLSQTLKV